MMSSSESHSGEAGASNREAVWHPAQEWLEEDEEEEDSDYVPPPPESDDGDDGWEDAEDNEDEEPGIRVSDGTMQPSIVGYID